MGEYKYFDSSLVQRAKYDNGDLYITFGNGKEYKYSNVPKDVYNEFISAPSVGKYFHANIKGKYESQVV